MKPTYEELFQHLKEALAEIQLLKAEVKELKDYLNTNSSNSSQPLSQDPFRAPKNLFKIFLILYKRLFSKIIVCV